MQVPIFEDIWSPLKGKNWGIYVIGIKVSLDIPRKSKKASERNFENMGVYCMFFQKETSHKLIYCLQSTLCFQICLLSNSMFLFIHIQYFFIYKTWDNFDKYCWFLNVVCWWKVHFVKISKGHSSSEFSPGSILLTQISRLVSFQCHFFFSTIIAIIVPVSLKLFKEIYRTVYVEILK